MAEAPELVLDEWADSDVPMAIADAGGMKFKLQPEKKKKKEKAKGFRFCSKNAFLTYSNTSHTPQIIWDDLCTRATVAKPLR